MAHSCMRLTVLAVLIFLTVSVNCSKLNVPRVLIPWFSDISLNFTLKVTDGGCYKWTASRGDVIQLIPVNGLDYGCSSEVVVSAITKEAKRDTVIVFAEEIHSKQILPCDVIVDVIHSLQIGAHTRELYVEEAPETLWVVAQDSEGNTFSTLEGVEMVWTVNQLSASSGVSSVRFISFKDSPYDTPPSIARFDEVGVRGHIVLVEGIKTGSARVSVRLPQNEYRNVPQAEALLTVVANLIIDPADVYIMPGDSVKYRLLQVRHGRLREIELPSQQYYLEVEDSDIATMDTNSCEAEGLKVGQTKVALRDRNISPSESGVRVPTATLNVALPAFLHLTLLPHRNWAVLVDVKHDILVEVYDRNNHKFYSNAMRVKVTVPSKHFYIESSTANGTYHVGWGVEPGTARVEAVLEGVKSRDGTEYPLENTISAHEDMLIYPRMEIQPKEVVIPWDPRFRARYEVKLKCVGGDGFLNWNSANTSVAIATQAGVVLTQALGQTTITASMTANPYNRATASVLVLPPTELHIIDNGLEAEVGSPVHLQVAIYTKRSPNSGAIPFTKCNELPLKVSVDDGNFVYEAETHGRTIGEACTTVAVVGKSLGTSKVTITYSEGDIYLEDSVTVAAYRPLTVLHPASGETVLALGTSRQLVFVGGPRPWPGRSSEHGKIISAGDESKVKKDLVEVFEIGKVSFEILDRHVYTVLCRTVGETFVTLTVYNEVISGQRIESKAKVRVFCAKPRFASLQAVLHREDNSPCPMNVNSERVAVQSSQDVLLELKVTDVHGRTFDNITSILMEWTASPERLSQFVKKDGVFAEEIIEKGLVLPSRHLQTVHPLGETGAVDITVRLTGYRSVVLRPKQITPEWPPFAVKNDKGVLSTPDISATLGLLFVKDTVVTPSQATLFNHPNSRLVLEVNQGSGYFQPQLDSQDVVVVHYSEQSHTLEVQPRTTGVAQFGLVDLCLPSRPATVVVTVVGVHSLLVDVPDRLEVKHSALCSVHITDTMGNPLELSDLSMLDLHPELDETASAIIGVRKYESDPKLDKLLGITGPPVPGEFRFIVHGRSLGDATLSFVTGHGTYEVRSPSVNIQVFDGLHLFPRNVTILVGSQLLIGVSGGPSTGSVLEFSVTPTGYARVSNLGVLEGEQVGHTKLTARAVGVSRVSGNKMVFSEDMVDVFVVPLSGIRIECPLTRIKANSVVPVWVTGLPEAVNPLVLGTVKPALAFEWDLSSREIAELGDVLEGTGITVTNEHRLSVRVKALAPGRITLKVSVFALPATTLTSRGVLFEDELQLEIYDELHVTHPLSIANKDFTGVLMAPETEMQLHTNRDGVARVLYGIQGYSGPSGADSNTRDPSVVLRQQNSLLTVSPTGLVTSHSASGRTSITISSLDETNLRQTLGLSIEVKPVHYIMTSVHSTLLISPGTPVKALPKGLELNLEVTYHDNTGAVFAATRTDITMRASRNDLIQFGRGSEFEQMGSNASFHIGLVHSGDTVLRISDELTATQATDYVKLPIEEFIFPTEAQVTVGDVICFSMPLETSSGERGHWSTDNPEILALDHDSGLGLARSQGGPVLVKYHLAHHVVSSTEVEVAPIKSMTFVKVPEGRLLNQVEKRGTVYRLSLVLNGGYEKSKASNILVRQGEQTCMPSSSALLRSFPFTCEARFNSHGITTQIRDVFDFKPVFDHSAGLYACELVSTGHSSAEISRLQTNVTLRANAEPWAGDAVTSPLVLPFLPIFFLVTPEVVLVGGAPGHLEIVAVPEVLVQLQVQPLDETVVHVYNPQYTSETSVRYEVVLTNKFWTQAAFNDNHYINVVSPLTEQNIQVPLKLRLEPDQWSAPCVVSPVGSLVDLAYTHRHSLVVIFSVITVALGTLYVYATFIQPALRSPAQPFLHSSPLLNMSAGYQSGLANASLIASPISPNINQSHNRSAAFSDTEPVYGDPRLYYDSRGTRPRRILT